MNRLFNSIDTNDCAFRIEISQSPLSLSTKNAFESTKGPWTARSTLNKVDEVGQNYQTNNVPAKMFKTGAIFNEKVQCASSAVKTATKKALFYGHTTVK